MTDYKDLLKSTIFETIQNDGWIQFESSKDRLDTYIETSSEFIPEYKIKQKINYEIAIPYRLPPGKNSGYCKEIIDIIKERLIELSFVSEEDQGGAQTYLALGSWVNSVGQLEQDECLIVYTAVPISKWESSIKVLRNIIKNEIQVKLQQKCVFLRINGETWGAPINLMEEDYIFASASEFGEIDTRCFSGEVNDYEKLDFPPTSARLSIEKYEYRLSGHHNQQTNIKGNITNTVTPKFLEMFGSSREREGRLIEQIKRMEEEKLSKFEASRDRDERIKIANEVERLDIFRDVSRVQKPNAETSIKYGEIAEFKGNFILAHGYYRDAKKKSRIEKDDLGIAKAEAKIASLIKVEQPGKAKELLLTCMATANLYNDQELEATVSTSLGNLLSNEGEYEQAMKLHVRTKEIHEKTNAIRLTAVPINNIAVIHAEKGNDKAATEMYREAYEIDKKYGSRNLPIACKNLAQKLEARFKENEARELYQEGLRFAEKYGDRKNIALVLTSLGTLESVTGNFANGMKMLERSEQIFKSAGIKEEFIFARKATVAIARGNYEEAEEFLISSIELCKKSNEIVMKWYREITLASLYFAKGDFDKSIGISKDIIRKAKDKGLLLHRTHAMGNLYEIYLAKGEYEMAEKIVRDIIKIEGTLLNTGEQTANLKMLCEVLIEQNKFEESESTYKEYRKILSDSGYNRNRVYEEIFIRQYEAKSALMKKDFDIAESAILESIGIYRPEGMEGDLCYDKEILSRVYFEQEKIEQAFEVIIEAIDQANKNGYLPGELHCSKTKLEFQKKLGRDAEATVQRVNELKEKMSIDS